MSRFIERGLRDSVVGDAPLLEGGLALWPLGNCAFAWMNSLLKEPTLKGPLTGGVYLAQPPSFR